MSSLERGIAYAHNFDKVDSAEELGSFGRSRYGVDQGEGEAAYHALAEYLSNDKEKKEKKEKLKKPKKPKDDDVDPDEGNGKPDKDKDK